MATDDWITLGWLIFLFGFLAPLMITSVIMWQLPRGFRWMWPVSRAIGLKIRHLFFRVFYPERMDEDRWNHRGCHCKKCTARRARQPKILEADQAELAKLEQYDRQYRQGWTEWDGVYGMWTAPPQPVTSQPCIDECVAHGGPDCVCGIWRTIYDAKQHESMYP